MVIENWSVVIIKYDPYKAPEQQDVRIEGYVFGSPLLIDGDPITTSTVVGIEDGKVRTASGSLYELGEVDPEYEKFFPGARERLLKGEKRNGRGKTIS